MDEQTITCVSRGWPHSDTRGWHAYTKRPSRTLADIKLGSDGLRIFMLQLPFKDVMARARQRRRESSRYDDHLAVALAKLYSQYQGMRSEDAPSIADPDVTLLDACLPTTEIVENTVLPILESRKIQD